MLSSKLDRVIIYFHLYSYRIDIKTLKPQQSVLPRGSSGGVSTKYMTAPCTTSLAVKLSSKPVSTATTRALNTSEKAMLPSFQRHSGLTKPMGKAPKSLEKLSPKPPLTNQGQGLACCVSQRSALFSKHVLPHH